MTSFNQWLNATKAHIWSPSYSGAPRSSHSLIGTVYRAYSQKESGGHFFRVHLHRYTRAIHKKTTQIVKLYFNVGNTEVAVLQTVFVISYIIFAPIIGYFGDKCNRKWILIMGILLQVASILAGSFVVDSFNQLLVTRIALGIAECILNVVCFPFVSDLYPASSRSMIIQVRTYIRTYLVVNPRIGSFVRPPQLAPALATYWAVGQRFTSAGGSMRCV